jgi:ubiquinone/menaquinone biosynthesis C-methylase UbiE
LQNEFNNLLKAADNETLVGWDLSYGGRISTSTPWNFEVVVDQCARNSPDMLDMGTGGGEWLSKLAFRPARTVATEGWPPNIPIARKRLEALGIELVVVDDVPDNAEQNGLVDGGELPFEDASFKLVVNRHESFVATDVARILVSGGRFLTQQVASDFNADCYRLLGLPFVEPSTRWKLDVAVKQLQQAGMTITDAAEGEEILSFEDIGAFSWYLKNVPYVCPDFSITRFRDRLEYLHKQIVDHGALKMRQSLFWLNAVK